MSRWRQVCDVAGQLDDGSRPCEFAVSNHFEVEFRRFTWFTTILTQLTCDECTSFDLAARHFLGISNNTHTHAHFVMHSICISRTKLIYMQMHWPDYNCWLIDSTFSIIQPFMSTSAIPRWFLHDWFYWLNKLLRIFGLLRNLIAESHRFIWRLPVFNTNCTQKKTAWLIRLDIWVKNVAYSHSMLRLIRNSIDKYEITSEN